MTRTTSTGVADYLRANPAMPVEVAALFASDLAGLLAAIHANGRAHGPLEAGVRVDPGGARPRPVIVGSPAPGVATPADDVRALGLLLARLLGARTVAAGPARPDGVPDGLWDLVVACLEPDPRARPSAALMARRLRSAARDILLGLTTSPAAPSPIADPDAPVPAFVPRPVPAPTAPQARRRRGWYALAGGVAAVVLAGAAAAFILLRPVPVPSRSAEACLPPYCAAKATFRASDAFLVVCDNEQDGLSAVALYRRADQPEEKGVWASSGKGTCVNHDTATPEGTTITFKVCTGERRANRIERCSKPVTGTG